jgi:hypothetical protein
MSDIYLQITETPTVVTLSAPVVSGALASTVTVANTVTVSLDSNSLSALENVTVTVGAAITGTVTVGNSVTISSLPAISGTVTANVANNINVENIFSSLEYYAENYGENWPVVINNALPSGSNNIGTVAIGSIASGSNRIGFVTVTAGTSQIGSVTASISNFPATQAVSLTTLPALVAGTAQIGSVTASISNTVTASISGTVPISISSVTVGNSVTIASLPAISGTVTANTFALQGTAVTTSNFTSTTASTVLASYNATRQVLTIFNEGAGNLHICAGATCTTIAYQVRLSAGDYYEVPNHQTTITHSAVFATAGTARVTEVS